MLRICYFPYPIHPTGCASDSEYLRIGAHRAVRNVYSETANCYADRIEPDIAVNHGTIGAPFRAAFWIAPGYSRRGMQVNLLRVNKWMADIYHFFGSPGVDSGPLRNQPAILPSSNVLPTHKPPHLKRWAALLVGRVGS